MPEQIIQHDSNQLPRNGHRSDPPIAPIVTSLTASSQSREPATASAIDVASTTGLVSTSLATHPSKAALGVAGHPARTMIHFSASFLTLSS
ncbi:hypothetical protein I6A84_19900 [Frankia sp. CNm7]|uniref:Uncharacterized protein n=1 Tax=Frankia nepalensis TaxID=1836974 RepID=A0A937RDP2_9ACTN|nr:hypothetical protein [Frankia nepalensis]MBL7501293.1 hypothetical protein [Frankia nepalensis]MBL7510140.1 hypothetical protein [Frankia nepalensis]MBL7520289.1 hypothetical protein [Frankia nepalensis]MBL7627085.1 hypothetical protein [Frankia nepalensis]